MPHHPNHQKQNHHRKTDHLPQTPTTATPRHLFEAADRPAHQVSGTPHAAAHAVEEAVLRADLSLDVEAYSFEASYLVGLLGIGVCGWLQLEGGIA